MNESRTKSGHYYPLFLSIEGRTCLVVGGGAVAERKVRSLLKYGASVRLIARELTPWLKEQCSGTKICLAGDRYEKAHLESISLVFAATSDMELNRVVAEDARVRGLWCNMATDPELGSFIVPSVVEKGVLSIAISTAGLSPAVAKMLREKLESEFGAEWEFFIELLGELRKYFKSRHVQEKDCKRVFSGLAALPVPQWLREGGEEKALLKVSEICSPLVDREGLQLIWDDVWKPFFS